MDSKRKKNKYRGLLECPLKGGYIEFEFDAGDKVSDLLNAVNDKWGRNYYWAQRNIKDEGTRYGRGIGWMIACEDKSGAYFVLHEDNQIPIVAPPSGDTLDIPPLDVTSYEDWPLLPKNVSFFSFRVREAYLLMTTKRGLLLELLFNNS